MKIKILGTNYSCEVVDRATDKNLADADGYCDWTTRRIVIAQIDDTYTVGNPKRCIDKVLRHEIIHAFMYESGLQENATFDDEHFEQMVDWIAFHYPKMRKVFKELGIEE